MQLSIRAYNAAISACEKGSVGCCRAWEVGVSNNLPMTRKGNWASNTLLGGRKAAMATTPNSYSWGPFRGHSQSGIYGHRAPSSQACLRLTAESEVIAYVDHSQTERINGGRASQLSAAFSLVDPPGSPVSGEGGAAPLRPDPVGAPDHT